MGHEHDTGPWVLDRLGGCLRGRFAVEHATLQLEPAGRHAASERLACEVPDQRREH